MYATAKPQIREGKLVYVSAGRSQINLGIRSTKNSIRQIESSRLPLRPSTIHALDVLREGVRVWEAFQNPAAKGQP